MNEHAKVMHEALERLDVPMLRRLSAEISPGLPQPRSDEDVLARAHVARTQMMSMPFKMRAYSHRWLTERGLPSLLPDGMKPRAERMYPVTVGVVGISVNAPESRAGMVPIIRSAMENAVLDCYANGDTSPMIVKPRMMEAKQKAVKKLMG